MLLLLHLLLVINTLAGRTTRSLKSVFSISNGIAKKIKKKIGKKKKKDNKIVLLAISKLNSIENIIFKALPNNNISEEEFITIINEAENCCNLRKVLE